MVFLNYLKIYRKFCRIFRQIYETKPCRTFRRIYVRDFNKNINLFEALLDTVAEGWPVE